MGPGLTETVQQRSSRTWTDRDLLEVERYAKAIALADGLDFDRLSQYDRELLLQIFIEKVESGDLVLPEKQAFLGEVYDEIPVPIEKWIEDPNYVGKWYKRHLYDVWKEEIIKVINGGYIEWIVTGSIGSGKTSAAILANLYKLYEITCMKDPCSYYSTTTITFGLFSVVKYLSQDVEANMLITRILESPYFKSVVGVEKEADDNRRYRSVALQFPKNIRFIFGSHALHSLGQDVYGGVMDEIAFDPTPEARKVRELYDSVRARIESRFMTGSGNVPGLLCVVSSSSREGDFLQDHLKSAQLGDRVYVSSKAVYDVKPFPGVRFRVLVGDKLHTSKVLDEVYTDIEGKRAIRQVVPDADVPSGARIEAVPYQFYPRFVRNVELALRDISGISLFSTFPFLPVREQLTEMVRLQEALPVRNSHPFTLDEPVISLADDDLTLESIFKKEELFTMLDRFRNRWTVRVNPATPRFIHADLAKTQDCVGLSCVHLYGFRPVQNVDFQGKESTIQLPVIYVDFVLRIKPPEGSEIDFTKITSFVFFLRHMGLAIQEITADSYQSSHFLQIVQKEGIDTRTVSVDRNPEAYLALKQGIMAGCVLFYNYNPLLTELAQLQALYTTPKGGNTVSRLRVDHPLNGSKDCADALAGSHYACITSKFTESRYMESRPVVSMGAGNAPKVKRISGVDDPAGIGTSWVYGDVGDAAGRITSIENNR